MTADRTIDATIRRWCDAQGATVSEVDGGWRVDVPAPRCGWLMLRGEGRTLQEAFHTCRDRHERLLSVGNDEAYRIVFADILREALHDERARRL